MTELVWNDKYDEKRHLHPVERTILPFQVVETINESKADREKTQLDFLTKQRLDSEWRNKLIWGDNKVIMSSLLPQFAGKINLIYIDPPFATGQDFSFRVRVGDEEFVKEPSIIEEKAYRHTRGRRWSYNVCPLGGQSETDNKRLTLGSNIWGQRRPEVQDGPR